MKDILAGITESALVIADLTGANPNVYYELGLAHAFRKRVILLAQRIDELPFDLRSYRVIPYSTHFAEIAKAKAQLVTLAREALDDRIPFGSPVTDFLPGVTAESSRAIRHAHDATAEPREGEPGILDHLVDLEEGFAKLGEIIDTTTAEMASMTEASSAAGERLTALAQANSPARTRRGVVITLAAQLAEFAESLGHHNDEYAKTLATTRSSLESLIRGHVPSTEEEKGQLQKFLRQLDQTEETTRGQRAALGQLIETIRSTPRVERTFNRAADNAVLSLEGYAQNVDQTISMIVRARELTQNRLPE